MKKLPEKFGNNDRKGLIFSSIHSLVYDSQSPADFDDGWSKMLEMFDLYENNWLSGLYKDRSRWVPCFLKTSFWARMSTTQRSEGINAFFDGYVHSKTSLKQFVEQYERAMKSKVEKEFHADFKSFSQIVPCATKYEMEKQFQETYTITKFREFQEEFTGKVYCVQIGSLSTEAEKNVTEQILVPKLSRTKGSPKKLRRKGPLEASSKKPKGPTKGKKSRTLVQPVIEKIGASIQPSMQHCLPILLPNLGDQFQPWSHCYGVNLMPTFQLDRNLSVHRHLVEDALHDVADECTSEPIHRLNM
ncbi:Protein FAR1-RELATED SEQUENCE [Abeliophyllum distichum]|uniref:Protein FAR1-RELATED SEQUENCE n=1 Tax=Abeliophyllum distichum TaxID=126358 RepID=A0ABD1QFP9_9LAMI